MPFIHYDEDKYSSSASSTAASVANVGGGGAGVSSVSKYDRYLDDIYLFNYLNNANNLHDKFKRRFSQNICSLPSQQQQQYQKYDNIHKDVLDLRSGSRASYYSQFSLNLDVQLENRGKRIRSGSRTPNTSSTKLPPLENASRLGSSQELTERLSASLKSVKSSIEQLPNTDNKKRLPQRISIINGSNSSSSGSLKVLNTNNNEISELRTESPRNSNNSLANFMTPRGSSYQLPRTPISQTRLRTGSVPTHTVDQEPLKKDKKKKNKENIPDAEKTKTETNTELTARKISDPLIFGGISGNRIVNNSLYKRLLAIHEDTLKRQAATNMDFYEDDFDERQTHATTPSCSNENNDDDDNDETKSQVSSTNSHHMHRSASVPSYQLLNISERLNTIDESANEHIKLTPREMHNDEVLSQYTTTTNPTTVVNDSVKKVKKPITTTQKPKNDSNTKLKTTKPVVATKSKPTNDTAKSTQQKKSASATDMTKLEKKKVATTKQQPPAPASLQTQKSENNEATGASLAVVATKILQDRIGSSQGALQTQLVDQTKEPDVHANNSMHHARSAMSVSTSPTKKLLSNSSNNLEITSSKINLKIKEKQQPAVTSTSTASTNNLNDTQQVEPSSSSDKLQVSQKTLNYLQSMTMFYDRTETKVYDMFDNYQHPLAAKTINKVAVPKNLTEPKKFLHKQNYIPVAAANVKRKVLNGKKPLKKISKGKKVKSKKTKKGEATGIEPELGATIPSDVTIENPANSEYNNTYENEDFEEETSGNESDLSVNSTTTGISIGDVAVYPVVPSLFTNHNHVPLQQQQTDQISQKFLYSKNKIDEPDDSQLPIKELEQQQQENIEVNQNTDDRQQANTDSINSNSISSKSNSNIRKVYTYINSLKQNSFDNTMKNNTQSFNSNANAAANAAAALPPKPNGGRKQQKKQFELPPNLVHALIGSIQNTYVEEDETSQNNNLPNLEHVQLQDDDEYGTINNNQDINLTIKSGHNHNPYHVLLDSVGSETTKSNNSGGSGVEAEPPSAKHVDVLVIHDDDDVNYASRNNTTQEATSARKSLLGVKDYNEFPHKWKKGCLLGRGAFGTVFQAMLSTGEIIAVKEVEMEESDPVRARKDYENVKEEVNILRGLNHINIVKFMGTALEANIVNIFMEFIAGGTIESLLKIYGPFDETLFRNFTNQIVEGVNFIHSNNVVHRDIKGRNIMLMQNGIIKLIDFGCAKRLKKNQSSNSTKHLLKSLKGTPYWMAPEVIRETGHGSKADIWSIGCTIFEMATGQPPWSDMKPIAAIYAIGSGDIPPPVLPQKFSQEARNFVRSCLQRDQDYRPTATELLNHEFFKLTLET